LQLGRIRGELPVRKPVDQLALGRVQGAQALLDPGPARGRNTVPPSSPVDRPADVSTGIAYTSKRSVSARPGRATSSRNGSWYEQFSSKK
jgi:hypothetical protein